MNSLKEILFTIFSSLFFILMVEIGYFYLQSSKSQPLEVAATPRAVVPMEKARKFVFDRFEQTHDLLVKNQASQVLLIVIFFWCFHQIFI